MGMLVPELERCKICGTPFPAVTVKIGGYKFKCCEDCRKNIRRCIDWLEVKMEFEKRKREIKSQEKFIDEQISKLIDKKFGGE